MLLSLRKNGRTSLFKEVKVFKVFAFPCPFLRWAKTNVLKTDTRVETLAFSKCYDDRFKKNVGGFFKHW